MKRTMSVVLAGATLFSAGSSFACVVPNNSPERLREIVAQQGGWPMTDATCEFLRKNKLYLRVVGQSTVLNGTSIGWVVVSIKDQENISSDESRSSTYANSSFASMDKANELTMLALKDAIADLDVQKAASQIAAYRKAVKPR